MLLSDCPLLSIKEKEAYQACYAKSKTDISEYAFNSRIAWNQSLHARYLMIEECFCVLGDGGTLTEPHFLLPLGTFNLKQLQIIVDKMAEIFSIYDWPLRCLSVDESYLDIFREIKGYQLTISYNEDFSDYVYQAENLRTLKGRDYRGKRNHINHFMREYPDYQYTDLTKNDKEEALKLVQIWCQEKDVDCSDTKQSDYLPIKALFDHFSELDIFGGAIRVRGELIAFSVGSIPRPDYGIIHFEKGHPLYEGVYPTINALTARNAYPEVVYLNREEDMGIEGMRIAKLSYKPLKQVHKYEIVFHKL